MAINLIGKDYNQPQLHTYSTPHLAYLTIIDEIDGGRLRVLTDREYLESSSFKTDINDYITNANNALSLNIPTYNQLGDLNGIYNYLYQLDTVTTPALRQVQVSFYLLLFSCVLQYGLSMNLLTNAYATSHVLMTADVNNDTYSVYFQGLVPDVYETWTSVTDNKTFTVLVNAL